MTLKLGKKLNFKEPECKLTTKDYYYFLKHQLQKIIYYQVLLGIISNPIYI